MTHNETKVTKFHIGLNNSNMDKQTVKPQNIIDYVKDHFKGATIYESKGVWKGSTENGMVIEIAGNLEDQVTNNSLTSLIKKEKNKDEDSKKPFTVVKESLEQIFNQDSVMTTRENKEVRF